MVSPHFLGGGTASIIADVMMPVMRHTTATVVTPHFLRSARLAPSATGAVPSPPRAFSLPTPLATRKNSPKFAGIGAGGATAVIKVCPQGHIIIANKAWFCCKLPGKQTVPRGET